MSSRPLLSIIVPTITGREESLERVRASYLEKTDTDMEMVLVQDAKNWPTGCNIGAKHARGLYLHFGADDLEPASDHWWQEAMGLIATRYELPAARVMECREGTTFYYEDDGPDRELAQFTRVPMLSVTQYARIGPWPDIDYYADVWVSMKARNLGIETRNVYEYEFRHYWSQVGRLDTPERMQVADEQFKRLVNTI